MKRYIPLLLCALFAGAQDSTNTPPSTNSVPHTNSPIHLQSHPQPPTVKGLDILSFRDGVLYGSGLARRNADVDGELLVQFALAAWRRDHPETK